MLIAKSPARVYVVMGDGELAEGQLWEAAMASARYKLDSVTAILDRNRIQATGPTKDIFDIPNLEDKWRAFGWHVEEVDGHDVGALLEAFSASSQGTPLVVIARTSILGRMKSFPATVDGHFIKLEPELEAAVIAELQEINA